MDRDYSAWAARWRVPLGFALAIAYLVFSQPTLPLLIAGGALALLGLAVRGWAAGVLEKDLRLATGGPYRYSRNPLYLGSGLIGMGLGIASGSAVMMLAFACLFLLVYWPVIRREELSLRQRFGVVYDEYSASVPLLVPCGRVGPRSDARFDWARYRRNREYEAALGYVAALLFLVLKMRLR